MNNTTSYDYREAMKADILEQLSDNEWKWGPGQFPDKDTFVEQMTDCLWADDDVTGNGPAGEYTDAATSKNNVLANEDLLKEALQLFCDEATLIQHLFDWTYYDVTIRCYLLNEVLYDLAGELEEEGYFSQEEEEA